MYHNYDSQLYDPDVNFLSTLETLISSASSMHLRLVGVSTFFLRFHRAAGREVMTAFYNTLELRIECAQRHILVYLTKP